MLVKSDTILETFAFWIARKALGAIIAANTAMIAITTMSSMRVKDFLILSCLP
jgi:hypothetical protein